MARRNAGERVLIHFVNDENVVIFTFTIINFVFAECLTRLGAVSGLDTGWLSPNLLLY